jgi:hypothetical protein
MCGGDDVSRAEQEDDVREGRFESCRKGGRVVRERLTSFGRKKKPGVGRDRICSRPEKKTSAGQAAIDLCPGKYGEDVD